ncbi:hypothetical protein CCACVL1_16768 [Corchorus capsularis]|uniref:DUF8204 domain-containing protein n=2 Tax=Corchorus TaxID=93758 RepID=A0A1R3HVW4_COCAP|nr:hypothetical protein CCACVL1_16768 [Corchorus capsularis]
MNSNSKEEAETETKNPNPNSNTQSQGVKGKSCKGCLYYSSALKSKSQNPTCVGIPRTLHQVPSYIIGESELEASKEGRTLLDFKYACVGYSVFLKNKEDSSTNQPPKQVELPFCVGLEPVYNFFVFFIVRLVCSGEFLRFDKETMSACKRVVQLGFNAYSTSLANRVAQRQISQLVNSNGKRAFLVDTLALVRSLEAQGVPSKQAEAITAAITEVLNDSLENVSHSFVSKAEMQKSEMLQEANLSKFKSEVKSSQEHHFSMLQRETEKLRGDIEKMRSELRYEIDKVTAGQRLDLNLERGRIRDELANQNAETTNLTNKLDREIHALRAHLEAAKYDVIKYCIGTLVSISAVGLAVVRILM